MSRVYRIRLEQYYYYGSTVLSLEQRLIKHKYQSKKSPSVLLYRKAIEIGWDKATIELVEECGEIDEKALFMVEDKYIDLADEFCLNTHRAYLSEEEKRERKKRDSRAYRLRKRLENPLPSPLTEEEKKQHLREASARWRERNPDKVKEQHKKEWATRKPLTEEEKEAKRAYQREYMRKRRSKD